MAALLFHLTAIIDLILSHTQFRVTECTDERKNSWHRPDGQRHPHGAGVKQNTFRRNENSGPDDDPDDDGGAVHEAELSFETLLVVVVVAIAIVRLRFCSKKYSMTRFIE